MSKILTCLGGLLPDMLDMVVQDYQIRTMRANPEQAPNFFKRKRVRQDAFVKRLNGIMHALVSSSNEINSFHVEIAEIASALNMNMKAYNGVYEPIYPGRGFLFDPNLHAIDRPEVLGPSFNPKHLKGNLILFTVVVGVRYKTTERDWVVVAKAKVRLWQPVLPTEVILPPNKRRIEQTIDDD
jgi:hypothetical protein